MNKEKVLVLMGGISTEREISLKIGTAVAKALGEAGYEVASHAQTLFEVTYIVSGKGTVITVRFMIAEEGGCEDV